MNRPDINNQKSFWLFHESRLWEQGVSHIAGIDEAGRGPLAGPVVAAAVIFHPDSYIEGVNDSKKLSPNKREALASIISKEAVSISTGIVDEREIDRINILQATYQAMRQAVSGLSVQPEQILVDGHAIPNMLIRQTAIPGGDRQVFSIAAASIIAKVTRDRMMKEADEKYPQYGFAQHKGYGTKFHMEALKVYGACAIHRKSFAPVARQLRIKNLPEVL